MAEEQQGQEKTEEPTQRKLKKAQEEGQIARSRELNSVAIVTFGSLAALVFVPSISERILQITAKTFTQAGKFHLDLPQYLSDVAVSALTAVLPLSLVLFFAGIFSSVGVGGFVFAPKALQPKASRMSLSKGFGRMFSVKALVELAKSIAKFGLIAGVAVGALSVLLSELLGLGALPIETAVYQGLNYAGWAVLLIGSSLVIVAMIDVPFQMAQHKKQLKMTKQEVKDELKDSDGRPEVKAKVRALQQQVANRRMLDDVPEADVVITNPEHFSVAIQYTAHAMGAPVILAMGVDSMAFRIREVAREHTVTVVPAPQLARALYFHGRVGEEIPEGLYLAVAQVLAYVYQLQQFARGEAERPELGRVNVPDDFETGVES